MTEVEFDEELREKIVANLAAHEVREHSLDGRRHAAVAVVVLDSDAELHGVDFSDEQRLDDLGAAPGVVHEGFTGRVDGTAGGASLLLTRRGGNLSAHARQWAFPGGRIDQGETSLEAAMREANEEVGITLSPDDLLGRLDDFPTRSGYIMSPFVFWLTGQDPVANPDEVASVHRIGFHELQREDSPRLFSIPESDRPVLQMLVGGDGIFAPTGAIIFQFREVGLHGHDVRVDEYEQPVFAWK